MDSIKTRRLKLRDFKIEKSFWDKHPHFTNEQRKILAYQGLDHRLNTRVKYYA